MHKEWLEQLLNKVKLAQMGKVSKVLRYPIRMAGSKLLQGVAHFLSRPFYLKTKLFCGDSMIVVIPEGVSCHIYRYGYFEEGLTRMILQLLKPGMIFFDIGAHFGYYTLLSSRLVGKDGQVHAFEPTPTTFEVLTLNARRHKNIFVNNLAIFSANGVVALNDYGLEYSAFNSFNKPRLGKSIRKRVKAKKVSVKAVSIDAYVKEKGVQPDFIKIDAESAEWGILQGMIYTLSNIRPIISLEVGDLDIQDVASSRDLVRYVIKQGYEVYQYGSLVRPLVKHEVRESYNYDNLLFMPK